ncbi:amidase [Reticulibacter mediterranei]|uniref:N-acetylmuramoyl-L-alanine amidase n=1 Tax=Reticulibacter mediterranei TaxID=2778369 RepID=A0A8J3N5N4_9CHLR|nr:peptidoglycan recognition family protein [Reticulibacter mediterranei]GHO95327.1 amidase [Reticulibacter mediterranei]
MMPGCRRLLFLPLLICTLSAFTATGYFTLYRASAANAVEASFTRASNEFGVPVELLKAICYMEGRLSNHGGSPSIDQGYGCMHLVKNARVNTLDQAAQRLGVSASRLKTDMPTNIRGGAALLHDEALQLSSNHVLPATLADWYSVVAAYSHATTRATALMYADGTYRILQHGFSAQAEGGAMIVLAPQLVKPNVMMAANIAAKSSLPDGCVDDGKVDYAGAVDCILDPKKFDCNQVAAKAACTYQSAQRPRQYKVLQVVIHDIEGTALDALNIFQNASQQVSAHYIVDGDGTVYQVLHDQDIAYQAGNLWYNQHSIGIEHAGFAVTGWKWYNATEYLASAKLTAYLVEKYHIPPDHDHVVSHGIIPAPSLATTPNHVDPGPYWLWDYYLGLVQKSGVSNVCSRKNAQMVRLHSVADSSPNGQGEQSNFSYFYLYSSPTTASSRIQRAGSRDDPIDETDNVEAGMSFSYLKKVVDPAGTGNMLYEIWYGAEDQARHDHFARAELGWLAIPRGNAVAGCGVPVKLQAKSGGTVSVSGVPVTGSTYVIGDAPLQSTFVSAYTVLEDGTSNQWYEINYNHRQAWVPASSVVPMSS